MFFKNFKGYQIIDAVFGEGYDIYNSYGEPVMIDGKISYPTVTDAETVINDLVAKGIKLWDILLIFQNL